MSLTETIVYNDAEIFEFDADKIEISGGLARLLLGDSAQVFTQDFASSSGFTYDASKAQITGGMLSQIDQRPANAVFFANWETNKDANWADGTLTGTLLGGATVTGGQLVATGSASQGISYPGNSLDSGTDQTGCIRFSWIPSYSGGPSAGTRYIFEIGTGANRMRLAHETSAALVLQVNNSAGGVLANIALGTWSPTASNTYEFELNYDFTAGATRLFVNGVQQGSTSSATGVRVDSAISNFYIGTESSTGVGVSSTFNYFAYFSEPQHTANYTPPSAALPSTIYAESLVVLPDFTYTGPDSLQTLDTFATTEAGLPRYTVNGEYWDGAEWVESDDSYAQANTLAEVAANIDSFAISGISVVSIQIVFTDTNTLSSVSELEIDATGYAYAMDDPTITPVGTLDVNELLSFSATLSATGSDAVKFVIEIDGTDKYWDGAAWEDSDGIYAQSNTATEINDNLGELAIDGLGNGEDVRFKAFLHSADGNTTPTLTSHTFEYEFANPDPSPPNECIVYGDLRDILGDTVTDTTNAKLIVILNNTFFNGENIIRPSTKEASVDSTGSFSIDLVETSSVNVSSPYTTITTPRYKFQIQYIPDGKTTTTKKTLGYAAVPDSQEAALTSLTFQSEEI